MEQDRDLNPQEMSPEKKIIQEAFDRAEQLRIQRELEAESEQPQEELPDIPEDLGEPGQHTLSDMAGLGRLGEERKTFPFAGNEITIRTLTRREELKILSKTNAWPETARGAVYSTYAAALALEDVNGKPYFTRMPLGPKDDLIDYKFQEFQNLYGITIDKIAAEYQNLNRETLEKALYAKKE